MMIANELRIGNWLNFHGFPGRVTAQQIYKLSDGACFDEYPIPLTEEWLLKLGFAEATVGVGIKSRFVINPKNSLPVVIIHDEVENKFYIQNWGQAFINTVYIESVHQLQNLYFAIIKEELPTP